MGFEMIPKSNIPVDTRLKNEVKKFLVDHPEHGTIQSFTESAIIEKLSKINTPENGKTIDKKGNLELILTERKDAT
jgi:hypothetical protein